MTIFMLFGSRYLSYILLALGALLSAPYNCLLRTGAMVKPEERKNCQKRHSGPSTFIKYSLSVNLVS